MTSYDIPADNSIMVLDDDGPFRTRLGHALESRGFEVSLAGNLTEANAILKSSPTAFAVIDMRLADGNGLDVIEQIRAVRSDCKMVVLTGYGNIAAAVSAIRRGAVDFIAKPADADDVCRVLLSDDHTNPEPPLDPISASRVKWEHIQRVYELCDNNMSEAARRLKMHRRTLQRMLAKRAPL
jgi:two-component system response regulator RegA